MTLSEVKKLDIQTPHGVFTPAYTFDGFDPTTDTYLNFKLLKSAEDVYQDWLANKDSEPIAQKTLEERLRDAEQENELLKSQVETLSATTSFHEELIVEMAMKVYA